METSIIVMDAIHNAKLNQDGNEIQLTPQVHVQLFEVMVKLYIQLSNEMMEIKYQMMDEVWYVRWKTILIERIMSIITLQQHVMRNEVMELDMQILNEMMVT